MTKEHIDAFRALIEMCQVHGDFSNGVTDPTGTIDEGTVRAGEVIDEAAQALRAVSRHVGDEVALDKTLLPLFQEAMAWGRAYGNVVSIDQWFKLRDAKAKQLIGVAVGEAVKDGQ